MRHFTDALFEGLALEKDPLDESLEKISYKDISDLDHTVEYNKNTFNKTNRIFITGLAASGKSTLAKQLAQVKGAEVVTLDLLDYERNTKNYSNSEVPMVIESFFKIYKDIGDVNDRIESFIDFVLYQDLSYPVIIEGVQLLSFSDLLQEEYVIIIDLPTDQLVDRFISREKDWRGVVVNGVEATSVEHLKQLLKSSYAKDMKHLHNFSKSLRQNINEKYDPIQYTTNRR